MCGRPIVFLDFLIHPVEFPPLWAYIQNPVKINPSLSEYLANEIFWPIADRSSLAFAFCNNSFSAFILLHMLPSIYQRSLNSFLFVLTTTLACHVDIKFTKPSFLIIWPRNITCLFQSLIISMFSFPFFFKLPSWLRVTSMLFLEYFCWTISLLAPPYSWSAGIW